MEALRLYTRRFVPRPVVHHRGSIAGGAAPGSYRRLQRQPRAGRPPLGQRRTEIRIPVHPRGTPRADALSEIRRRSRAPSAASAQNPSRAVDHRRPVSLGLLRICLRGHQRRQPDFSVTGSRLIDRVRASAPDTALLFCRRQLHAPERASPVRGLPLLTVTPRRTFGLGCDGGRGVMLPSPTLNEYSSAQRCTID